MIQILCHLLLKIFHIVCSSRIDEGLISENYTILFFLNQIAETIALKCVAREKQLMNSARKSSLLTFAFHS